MLTTLFAALRRRVDEITSSSLHLNAYALVLNQVGSAGLGVFYWMLAARLFSAEVVGSNSATISTLMLLGYLGSLGLKGAMVRFVPRSGEGTPTLVMRTYAISIAASVLISFLFVEGAVHFQILRQLSGETDASALWFIVATVVWAIFTIQDGVLTGLRRSVWVLVENQLFNIAKMSLLVPALLFAYNDGIAISWFAPVGVIVVIVNAFIFLKLIPRHVDDTSVEVAPVDARQAMPSVTADYAGSMLAEIGTRMLPLMVVNLQGASATAYFYQAWLISVSLISVTVSMASSFTAESSANRSMMRHHSISILRQMSYLVIPASALIVVFAPLVLGLFGPAYAEQGTPLLRYLAIAAPTTILSSWYAAYARVKFDSVPIVLIQGAPALMTLGLSYLWLPQYGIASIGLAWLISNILVTAWVVVKSLPVLLAWNSEDEGKEMSENANEIWRRTDWRFFLPSPRPRLSVNFSRGLLSRAIEAISDETVDGPDAPAGECDVAVVSDPTAETLLAAHTALKVGGACYSEWPAWKAGGTRGIRKKLESSGFSDVRLYWAYPRPDRARFWMPLPAGQGPCTHLASYLGLGQGRLSRLVVPVLCRIMRTVLQAGIVPSLSAVAYKGRGSQMDLLETLDETFCRYHPEASRGQLSFLVLTGGFRVDNSIDCLVFDGIDHELRWVAKIPRLPASAGGLSNEEKVLSELGVAKTCDNGHVLPAVVDRFSLDRVQVHVQTALTGPPLQSRITTDSFAQIARQMTDFQIWLAGLPGANGGQVDCLAYVDELLAKLSDQDGPLLDELTSSEVRAIAATAGSVRTTLAHNDFSPWNMRYTDSGIGVFDWVDAGWNNLPVTDLVYGLSTLAFQLDQSWDTAQMLATYRGLLDASTPAGAVFRRETARYGERIGLLEAQVDGLRVITWIQHGWLELRDFRLAYGGDAARRWLLESVCLPLLRVELGMPHQAREMAAIEGGIGI